MIGSPLGRQAIDHVKDTFKSNLIANEVRGKEATGVAALKYDGVCRVEKLAVNAREFVETSLFADFLDKSVTEETTILLGHTRKPTKGSVLDRNNNHPIVVGDTVGIHNGTISNDDEFFSYRALASGKTGDRIGSVDSEAIFALMDDLDLVRPSDRLVADIRQATTLIAGSYSSLFFHRKRPGTLFLFRYDNPVSVHYEKQCNCLHFSSRYIFLRKTFGKSVISEQVPNKCGFIFEATRLRKLEKTPVATFHIGTGTEQQPTFEHFWRFYGKKCQTTI